MRELRSVAEQWSQSAAAPPPTLNLVAGSGLRLNDVFSCPNPNCRRRQIDVLFRHAWHYFDAILLPDVAESLLLDPSNDLDSDELRGEILGIAENALYIKGLGADSLVQYYPTTHGAYGHAAGSRLGQPTCWNAAWEAVENSILKEANLIIEKTGDRVFSVEVEPAPNESSVTVEIRLSEGEPSNEDYLRSLAAHQVASDCMAVLEEDLKLADVLRGPLASTLWSHQRAISAMGEAPDPANVAFNVSFPTLESVPINELIAIRQANGDAFLAFRDALTKAAREMSVLSRGSSRDRLATQIKEQIIDPEIARLNRRLRTARQSFAKKVVGTIALSSVGTLCAASLGAIPGVAAGAVITASAIGNLNKDLSKFIEEKDGIKLSDMYFIWKALEHAE
jgi:hypothetical protein